MLIKSQLQTDSIFIISSINKEKKDVAYGEELAETEILYKNLDPDIKMKLHIHSHDVRSKSEFLEVLSQIKELCSGATNPIIHIDCHGYTDGIQLKNDDQIHWDEIKEIIREINIKTNNNLIIVLNSCYGFRFTNATNLYKPSLCYVVIGFDEEVKQNVLTDCFNKFYDILFKTLNYQLAFNEANKEINYQNIQLKKETCEELFFQTFYKLKKEYTPEIRKQKWKEFVNQENREKNRADRRRLIKSGEESIMNYNFSDSYEQIYRTYFVGSRYYLENGKKIKYSYEDHILTF